jgi:hypothetical protein
MEDEIYEYLNNYGFSDANLNNLKEENEDMYFVTLNKVKENIAFFTQIGLTNKEIINLANNNPFILTLSLKRKNAFNTIYINKLNLTNEEIKYLLYVNNYIYTCSPIELDKIITYLNKDKGYSIDNIKRIIFTNPKIINQSLADIIKAI